MFPAKRNHVTHLWKHRLVFWYCHQSRSLDKYRILQGCEWFSLISQIYFVSNSQNNRTYSPEIFLVFIRCFNCNNKTWCFNGNNKSWFYFRNNYSIPITAYFLVIDTSLTAIPFGMPVSTRLLILTYVLLGDCVDFPLSSKLHVAMTSENEPKLDYEVWNR